ncbi:unnamed protein product [Microthlaspi erraticum]|uniref:RING-type E3 ubiquitin transferase n=1 Tax=Microthlaspi erraticum TaxID=1685480 RepID=A0A6D2KD32_9BRAS|nr:unnamed protein product [Microthlaspi erraticum]
METEAVVFIVFIIVWMMMMIIVIFSNCCRTRTSPTELPPETIHHQTPQPQQDIETGTREVLIFKDIKDDEEEERGSGKRICPICLEEYKDDHEIRRLKKCGHVFHRFCVDSWLVRDRSCPSCRSSVDLI